MLHRIRRIGIYQTSLIAAALYFLAGLLLSPLVWLMGRFAATEETASLGSFGAMAALFMPVIYAVIGFIMTAIACAIYNLVAKLTGGIEIELVAVESPRV